MPVGYRKGPKDPVWLPRLFYLGQEAFEADQDAQDLTLPAGCNIVEIAAEDGEIYWTINGVAASNSGGFVAENGRDWIGPMRNMQTLSVLGVVAGTCVVHAMFFREATDNDD